MNRVSDQETFTNSLALPNNSQLSRLPEELIQKIFSYFDGADLYRISFTCRSFNTFVMGPNYIGSKADMVTRALFAYVNSPNSNSLWSMLALGSILLDSMDVENAHCDLQDILPHLRYKGQTLKRMQFEWTRLEGPTARILAESFSDFPSLRKLDLTIFMEIEDEGARSLAEGFPHLSLLTDLNLNFNSIGLDGACALAQGFFHLSSLRTFDLHFNRLRADQANAIGKGISHLASLNTLNLSAFFMEGEYACRPLFAGFSYLRSLKTLGLTVRNIDLFGFQAVAEGLRHLKSLTSLGLTLDDSNQPDGVRFLAKGISCLSCLKFLHLDFFGGGEDQFVLGDTFVSFFSEEFSHFRSLKSLSCNGTNVSCFTPMIARLASLPNLTSLCLQDCAIDDDDAEILARQFAHLPLLTSLDLSYCPISYSGVKAILEKLSDLPHLTHLNLSHNPWLEEEEFQSVAEQLSHFSSLWDWRIEFESS